MSSSFAPLFPGMPLDAASRFAQDHAAGQAPRGDPVRDLGWSATLVPEHAGGIGGTLADLAAIVEGLAAHALLLPVVETCALVPLLLQAAAPDVADRWLEAVADGSARIAPLTVLSSMPEERIVRARHLDIGYELSGSLRGVDWSFPASHYLLSAEVAGEPAIFLIDAERVAAPCAVYRTMEGRHAADLALTRITVPEGACLAQGSPARRALSAATDAALLLTVADTVAALAALIQHTLTHLKERRQFGVPLSTFQVLRHRLADMYVKYLGARGLVLHCFQEHERRADDLRRTLCLAKVSIAESARWCAEAAIQMHGGMGLSEEVAATRLAQRLLASEFRYGDRLLHAMQLASARPAAQRHPPTPLSGSAR